MLVGVLTLASCVRMVHEAPTDGSVDLRARELGIHDGPTRDGPAEVGPLGDAPARDAIAIDANVEVAIAEQGRQG